MSSSASDISNLFQMLGVSPSHYQEVQRTEQVQGSRGLWSTQTGQSPVAATCGQIARDAQAASAEAPELTATAVAASAQVSASASASASAPATLPAADGQAPVRQSNPDPVVVAPQPDSLSAMFARLRNTTVHHADAAQRQAS
jgi:hypothetical protein